MLKMRSVYIRSAPHFDISSLGSLKTEKDFLYVSKEFQNLNLSMRPNEAGRASAEKAQNPETNQNRIRSKSRFVNKKLKRET